MKTDRVKWSTMAPTSSPTRSWLGHSAPRCRHSRTSSWEDVWSTTIWSAPLVTLSPVNCGEKPQGQTSNKTKRSRRGPQPHLGPSRRLNLLPWASLGFLSEWEAPSALLQKHVYRKITGIWFYEILWGKTKIRINEALVGVFVDLFGGNFCLSTAGQFHQTQLVTCLNFSVNI